MAKRSQELSVALNVRLPRGLYEKLQAVGGEGGMSAVVRDTLERGLAAEAPAVGDVRTEVLLRFVAEAAKAIGESYDKPWHSNVFLTQALRDAIGAAVEQIGAIGPRDEGGEPSNFLTPDDWDEAQTPIPPKPGSRLERLMLPPWRRFAELTVELLAGALWSLVEFDRIPREPSTAPPFAPPKP